MKERREADYPRPKPIMGEMTLEKAVQILTRLLDPDDAIWHSEKEVALKLGIEALKAVGNARANNYYTPIATLPGETEE